MIVLYCSKNELREERVNFMINQSRVNRKIKKILTILLFVLPAAVPLSIFWIYPMVKSIFISFTDWDYMSSIYNIVGLDNYKALASDEMFYQALKNTLAFMIGTVIPTIIIGLALAVLLKKSIKGGAFYKAIIFGFLNQRQDLLIIYFNY